MDKRRNGVVLFITLAVIASMLTLIGVIFSYLDESKGDAMDTSAMIQANLLYRDTAEGIKSMLKKTGNDKDGKKAVLEVLYSAPISIRPTEGDLFVGVECKPLDAAININWLQHENNETHKVLFDIAQLLFEGIMQKYNLTNPSQLEEMIKSAIDPENNRGEDKGYLKPKVGIRSLAQLERIVLDYRFMADDKEVEKIAWGQYFSFEYDSVTADAGYFSEELVSILFGIDIETVKGEWVQGEDLTQFVRTFGGDESFLDGKIFLAQMSEKMHCHITYGMGEDGYAFGFDYRQERIDGFEFYGKQ